MTKANSSPCSLDPMNATSGISLQLLKLIPFFPILSFYSWIFEKSSCLSHLFLYVKPSPVLFPSLLPSIAKLHEKIKILSLHLFHLFPFIVHTMAISNFILYSSTEQSSQKDWCWFFVAISNKYLVLIYLFSREYFIL